MRFALILAFIIISSCNAPAQSMLDKVKDLNLNSIEGSIPTYFSDGFKDRAEANLILLKKSIAFFEKNVGVHQSFAIAVMDSASWRKITSIPYGLPFVSGPPYIVCIPATSNNVLSNTIASAIDDSKLNAQYGMTNEEIVNLFVSLIGFHELGHIYAKAYGASFPNKWTFEFAATYFAYFYLDQNFPEERNIWINVSKILVNELSPRHTSLKDFEKMYVKVGVENYAWYQVVFLLRVQELYEEQGIDFLKKLKDHQWHSTSPSEYLNEMEEIGSGFTVWSRAYNLQ